MIDCPPPSVMCRPRLRREGICPTDAALASCLSRHRQEITARWIASIHALLPERPPWIQADGVVESCSQGLAGLIAHLESGSLPALDACVEAVATSKIHAGADAVETVDHVLYAVDAALPHLLDEREPVPPGVDRAELALRFVECLHAVVARAGSRSSAARSGLLCPQTPSWQHCWFARAIHDWHAAADLRDPAEARTAGHAPALGPPVALGLPRTTADEPLTTREVEVLREVAQGLDNEGIGEKLCISPGTVRTHISHILAKLHVRRRTQAALYALRHGIAEIEQENTPRST